MRLSGDFFEDDEDIEEIRAIFESGELCLTGVWHELGIRLPASLSTKSQISGRFQPSTASISLVTRQ